ISGNTSCAGEHNLTGTLGMQLLGLLRELERLIDVKNRRPRLRLIDGLLEFAPVRFEWRCGRRQGIRAHQHYAVVCRNSFQISLRACSRLIDEPAWTGSRGHPRGRVENQDLVARVAVGRSESELREGQDQQRQAQDLEQERPGLLQTAAVLVLRYPVERAKKSERGYGLFPSNAVQ